MFIKKTIRDVDLHGQRVLVRVDFNVPLDEGKVVDDTRLRAALPTLEYLIENGASAVLCSHLGRPNGEVVPSLSLRPVAKRLSELLGQPVGFVAECVGPEAQSAAEKLQAGEILMLENTRFHPEETANDPRFAAELASLADLFVNDAFGSAHRAHASTEGVAHYLPAIAGFLMEKELTYLGAALEKPEHPYVAILGGAKISDKIGVVERLLDQADQLLIGGAMANTFLAAAGNDMAVSLVEKESIELANDLIKNAGKRLMLPVDLVVADAFSEDAETQIVTPDAVPNGWRAMDIGPKTVEKFSDVVRDARLVVWNGPMGVFEFGPFAAGTKALAEAVAKCEGTTIVGGGDSAAAIRQAGLMDQIDHVSTGGGASLELIEGKKLPGVEILLDRDASDLM
jgi:phosphoglycerate kinase